jgi:malate dehydrogenase (quinone)
MLQAGVRNLSLVQYLVGQLAAGKATKFDALREFFPDAEPQDWYRITAGQRVQVIKNDADKGGVLQFGTELITSADGTIAGLLGASPGASTAVPIMLGLIEKCFSDRLAAWEPKLKMIAPSLGSSLGENPEIARGTLNRTARVLGISA